MSTETTDAETDVESADETSSMDEYEDVRDAVTVDHGATRISSIAAVLAAVVAAVTSAPFALLALPLGLGGVAMIAGGLFYRTNRTWVSVGAVCLYLSPIIAGGFGVPVEFLLVSVSATLLAWNFGQHAIELGEQVGRHSRTRRNEIIHAAVGTIVALLASSLGYAVYLFAGEGQPVAALSMLVIGGLLLAWAMRT